MKIVLTGGGTAGHAMANKVLISFLKDNLENQLLYIGSHHGAERDLISLEIDYYPISTGKLRRYFSLENARDFFRVLQGVKEAYQILKTEEANVVFSGGGFVSLPVVIAAWLLKIPVVIRETDTSPGLANKICGHFAKKIYTTFLDTAFQFGGLPCEYGGLIIRPELLKATLGAKISGDLPSVLIMGGSLGSTLINRTVWGNIQQLTEHFQLAHLTGKGQTDPLIWAKGYEQHDYVNDMGNLYARTEVLVTRCGSNAISEGLALGKRMVCIPLSTKYSRGEQLANAEYAIRHGCAVILKEEELSGEALICAINAVLRKPLGGNTGLTEQTLDENCQQLLKAIQHWGMQDIERRMIQRVQKGQPIHYDQLLPWEIQMYEEIIEQYLY